MKDEQKIIDPLPDSFETEEQAGEFWDTHSLADYEGFLEPADVTFAITKRTYEVQLSEDIYEGLRKEAEATHQSVPITIDRILRKELSLAK